MIGPMGVLICAIGGACIGVSPESFTAWCVGVMAVVIAIALEERRPRRA